MSDRFVEMQVFCRVAERGSFSRAAEELGYSRAAVSELVRALEQRLGARLLVRSTRRVALSPEGREFLRHGRQILDQLYAAEQRVAAAHAELQGRLRLQVPVALGRLFLAAAAARFSAEHPRLRLEVCARDGYPRFADDAIDMAVYAGRPREQSRVCRALGRFPLVTCAAPDYLALYGTPRTPEALARHRCLPVIAREDGRAAGWRFQRDGLPFVWTVRGALAFDDDSAAVAAAEAGAGVVQVAAYLVAEALAQCRLLPLLGGWQCDGPEVWLCFAQARPLPQRLRLCGEFLRHAFLSRDWGEAGFCASAAPARRSRRAAV